MPAVAGGGLSTDMVKVANSSMMNFGVSSDHANVLTGGG